MENAPLAFAISFLVSLVLVPAIIYVAKKTNILDVPGGRRIHKRKTPSLGGIAIFLGFVSGALLFSAFLDSPEFGYVFPSVLIIFLVGVWDDLVVLSAKIKMLGQILAALILVHFGGFKLSGLHGLFGLEELPVWGQYAVSLLTLLVITNAINLIDGIDGLAGSISILASVSFGLWFYYTNNATMTLLVGCMIGAVLGFLVFNISPAKIFMGDSGSLLLGFLLAFFAIHFIENTKQVGSYQVSEPVSLSIAILLYPLFDLLRVFVLRIAKGQSPFSGDKTHIHHILLRTGLNHNQATFTIVSGSALVILLAYEFNTKGMWIGFLTIIICCLVVIVLLNIRVRKFTKKSKKHFFLF
jgi:UDP-N-acetylmuramyl pentapeptide phosphotransferase/UDP-N-acetylglucosamine-1-phosphate transferase